MSRTSRLLAVCAGLSVYVTVLGSSVHATVPATAANIAEPGQVHLDHPRQVEVVLSQLINRERAAEGLEPLSHLSALDPVAQQWVDKMADSGILAHNPNLIADTTAVDGLGAWIEVGENVGYGPTVADLHRAFMASDSHRGNILYPDYTHMTVASTRDNDRWWVCVLFLNR